MCKGELLRQKLLQTVGLGAGGDLAALELDI